MFYLAVKAALSGVIIAIVSEVARRSPSLGALIVSLPLISILGVLWLWHDTSDAERIAAHAAIDFLVRASDNADVPGDAGDVAPRNRILGDAHHLLRAYLRALSLHNLDSGKIWRDAVMRCNKIQTSAKIWS